MQPHDLNQRLEQARQLMQHRHHAQALKLFAHLLKEFPTAGLEDEYAQAAATAGEFDLAERLWSELLAHGPVNANALAQLASEYGKIWLFAKARELSLRAAELEPANLAVQLSLASFLSRTNSVSEARSAVHRCLKLDPRCEQALYLAAHLDRRENKLTEAEHQFRSLLASALQDPQVTHFCRFELARILDRTERFDEAMDELRKAKSVALQALDIGSARKIFDDRRMRAVQKARALPKNILGIWNKSFPPEARTNQTSLAFLGGHARSGTTLLEKILDAHPAIAACDEALAFQTISPLIDVTDPDIPIEGLNFLRKRYLRNLTKVLPTSTEDKLLVDKNPPATAYLPAFLRAFPELRALIALRDPRDVLVSCFFEDLPSISHMSFERLAEHYSSVMDVWLAVREWEGLAWLETRYEDIVTDLAKEGSRVTDFFGLKWDQNQAKFHEKNREKPVMSTNYNDVTQPVYKRSVGRWQAYEKHLAPVLSVLEPYCKKFGYT